MRILFAVTLAAVLLTPGAVHADPITAAITASLVNAGLSTAVASFISGALVRAVGSIALNAVSGALFGKKASGTDTGAGFSTQAQRRSQVVRSAVEPFRTVYGETMVSGPLAFAETSGDNNEMLHLVVPVAGHEVEAIDSVFLNETEVPAADLDGDGFVTAGDYADKVRIRKFLGAGDQAADSDLVSECTNWTSAHRLRGIAYLYVRLEYDQDVFANGIPNVKCVVRGKKCYDPRTGGTAYTENPALHVRDYLTDGKLGLGARDDEIDDTAFAAAANVCEEFVDVADDTDTFTADAATDTLTRADTTACAFNTGDKCQVSSDDTLPSGLSAATDYYVIKTGAATFRLAGSWANAMAGTQIALADAGTGTHTVTTKGQVRYDAHGTVTADTLPVDVIEDVMTSLAGALVYTQGTYVPFAGAGASSSHSIDETWLRGPVRVKPRVQRDDLFNYVRGTFVDPQRFWQPTDFPPRENVLYEVADGGHSDTFTASAATDILTVGGAGGWFRGAERVVLETTGTLPAPLSTLTAYYVLKQSATTLKLAADLDDALAGTEIDITTSGSGTHSIRLAERLPRDIDLPFTQDATRAQRIANIHLEKGRQGATLILPCNMKAMPVAVWDVVDVTIGLLGYSGKLFRVIDWQIGADLGIDLTVQEEASASYDWNKGQATVHDPAPDTSLVPALAAVAPTSLTLTSGTAVLDTRLDGSIWSRIKVAWTAPADAFARTIELQYKKSADSTWQNATSVDAGLSESYILDVKDGVAYDVRIRAVNSRGKRSAWVTSSNHTVVGKTAAPADVTSLSASQNGIVVIFKWPQVTDVDLAGYEIRYMAAPFAWADATPLTEVTRGTQITSAGVPPGSWVFGIKARDTSENYSATAATKTLTVTNANDVVLAVEQAPAWPGTLTNFEKHWTGVLVPSSTLAASAHTNAELFEQYVAYPEATCTYEAPEQDLGFDANGVRVWADIVSALGPGETAGTADPQLSIDYKDNAASYDGFEAWQIGTADFRQIKSKITVTTANGKPVVRGFNIVCDVAERTESGTLTVGTGGESIVFAGQFHSVPNVQVTPESGLIPDKSNVTASGFDLVLRNGAGTAVEDAADWTATGA